MSTMEAKESKAQLEVWEWKERAYEQMKNMSQAERIAFTKQQTAVLVEKLRKNKAA
ncbi:hypothetical protein BH09BAC1_BH09BAC1_08140 [soil metagenome]